MILSVMNKPFTIGITGGSGSGKTYFLQGLSSHFKPEEICLISQDHYYKPRDQQQTDENGVINFDLPGAFDRQAFHTDLLQLKNHSAYIQPLSDEADNDYTQTMIQSFPYHLFESFCH